MGRLNLAPGMYLPCSAVEKHQQDFRATLLPPPPPPSPPLAVQTRVPLQPPLPLPRMAFRAPAAHERGSQLRGPEFWVWAGVEMCGGDTQGVRVWNLCCTQTWCGQCT
eukprot:365666-Chlamydomonas_euryale.AAC.6